MNSKTIATSEGIVEYTIHGKGTPILVVHGGHSNCNETLCLKGFDLDKYKLIIPSRPGYGQTPVGENSSVERTAKLLIALLDKLGIDKITVYGISTGGPSAIDLAANFPERVNKLILASAITQEWVDRKSVVYKRMIKQYNPKVEKFTMKIAKFMGKFNKETVMDNLHAQYTKSPKSALTSEEKNELSKAITLYESRQGFMVDIQQVIKKDLLSKVSCPTLIIHSENDITVPIFHATNAAKNIKNSTFRILNNRWGHMIWIGNEAESANKRIIEFIEK